MLPREEYIEQAYFFKLLVDRLGKQIPLQELLVQSKHELLASTKLPMAIDLLLAELRHNGQMSNGMRMLDHYFCPFQTFLIESAEAERGKFDYRTALRILHAEANYRSQENMDPQGLFFFQFEAISRNRLSYDTGVKAMSDDQLFDSHWQSWLLALRRQLGLVDLAEMIYVRSQRYQARVRQLSDAATDTPVLFGEIEGKIAHANIRKDPLYLFAAMQRHLGYPAVPRLEPIDPLPTLVPQLQRRMEHLEARIRLLEEEQKSGIDITKFYDGKLPPGVSTD